MHRNHFFPGMELGYRFRITSSEGGEDVGGKSAGVAGDLEGGELAEVCLPSSVFSLTSSSSISNLNISPSTFLSKHKQASL